MFGQLAAGGGGIFVPAPADRDERDRRRVRRIAAAGRADMGWSEAAVGYCMAQWHARTGRPLTPYAVDAGVVNPAELARVLGRLDEVSARWRALLPGGSLTLEWPEPAGAARVPTARTSRTRPAPTRRRAPR